MGARISWLAGLLATACAGAKTELGVVPRSGQVVSVSMPDGGGKITGPLTSIDPDSLTIESGGEPYRVASTRLAHGRVATSRARAVRKGATIGGVIGAVAGLVYGVIEESSYDCSEGCPYEGMATYAGLVLGAAAGAAIGGAVGATSTVPMWTPARPPGPSATFSADLQTGDIVRVTGSPDGNRAVVIGGSGDQVRVRFESGVETEVGIESILRFTGNHPRGGNGFLYGAAAGALVGTASYLFEDDSSEEASAGVTAAGVLLLSALGAAIGASVTAQPVPTWSMPGAVEPPTLSIRPLVTRDRFGLMGRLSF